MNDTRRFVVKRVGDTYVTVPIDEREPLKACAWTAGGSALVLAGVVRRGLWGGVLAIAGAAMIYRGVTGCDVAQKLLGRRRTHAPDGRPDQAPSYPNDLPRAPQLPTDEVEEASMESFPASDSPAWSGREKPKPMTGAAPDMPA